MAFILEEPMNTSDLTAHIEQTLETLAVQTGEAQHSEQFIEYLKSASRFHSYSLGNILLILWQKPTATRVAGYRAWQKMNRYVRKGEKGIAILAPCVYSDKTDRAKTRIFFKTVWVFDISQTDGESLPEINWRAPLSRMPNCNQHSPHSWNPTAGKWLTRMGLTEPKAVVNTPQRRSTY
jgi:hypothetical protein